MDVHVPVILNLEYKVRPVVIPYQQPGSSRCSHASRLNDALVCFRFRCMLLCPRTPPMFSHVSCYTTNLWYGLWLRL